MTKKSKFVLTEFAFVRIQGESSLLYPLERAVEPGIMLLLVTTVDEHVIHMSDGAFLSVEDLLHPALKVFGCTADTKQKFVEDKSSEWGDEGCEHSLLL